MALLHSQRRRLKNRLMAHIKGAGERTRELEDCVQNASRRVAGVEGRAEAADGALAEIDTRACALPSSPPRARSTHVLTRAHLA